MLRTLLAAAPPIALVLVGVLLVEPPYLTPADRIPTLHIFSTGDRDITTPEAHLRVVLSRLLGASNRGVERVGAMDFQSDSVIVEWRLNHPGRSSSPRTSAQQDVYALLHWARFASTPTWGWDLREFTFVGSQEGSSQPGTPSERRVLELIYLAEHIAGIDWDRFSPQDVYALADTTRIDPSLR